MYCVRENQSPACHSIICLFPRAHEHQLLAFSYHANNYTSTIYLQGPKVIPQHQKSQRHQCKYWYYIQSSSNILLQEALAVSQNLHEERIFTWFSFFSSLCKLVNVKPSDVTLETFVLLKEKLCDYYIIYWSERIKMFSKMDTYCLLKQRFGLENYISDVKKKSAQNNSF